ncbi:MAG: hypothetical protein ABIN61_05465 [candidate division WOR-3 bacterium]
MKIFSCFSFILLSFLPKEKDRVLELADKCFDAGLYEEAIHEYKRYIYFNPEGEKVSYAYYKMALGYREKGDLENSILSLESSILFEENDSAKEERKIDLCVTYIALKEYNKAKEILWEVLSLNKYSNIKREASLFLGISYICSYEWDSARIALNIYLEEKDEIFVKEVDSLLTQAKNLKYKSEKLAECLSFFIPGAGQIYGGNFGKGINAFILNAPLLYFTLYKLLKEEYGNAFIIYFLLSKRYYFGNIYNAKKIVREYNRNLEEESVNKFFKVFTKIEENK